MKRFNIVSWFAGLLFLLMTSMAWSCGLSAKEEAKTSPQIIALAKASKKQDVLVQVMTLADKEAIFSKGGHKGITVLEDFGNQPLLFVSVPNLNALEGLLRDPRIKMIHENGVSTFPNEVVPAPNQAQ